MSKILATNSRSPLASIQESIDKEQELYELASKSDLSMFIFWERIATYVNFLNSNEITSNVLKCFGRDVLAQPKQNTTNDSDKANIVFGCFQLSILGKFSEIFHGVLSDEDYLKVRELMANTSLPEGLELNVENPSQVWSSFLAMLPNQQADLQSFHNAFSDLLKGYLSVGKVPTYRIFDYETGILNIKNKKIEFKIDTNEYYLLKALYEDRPFDFHYFDDLEGDIIYCPKSSGSFRSDCKRVNEKALKLGIPNLIDYQMKDGSMMARIDISLKN